MAHTFITLNNNQVVQRCFLLHLLEAAALLPGKGKGKVVEDGDNSMSYLFVFFFFDITIVALVCIAFGIVFLTPVCMSS